MQIANLVYNIQPTFYGKVSNINFSDASPNSSHWVPVLLKNPNWALNPNRCMVTKGPWLYAYFQILAPTIPLLQMCTNSAYIPTMSHTYYKCRPLKWLQRITLPIMPTQLRSFTCTWTKYTMSHLLAYSYCTAYGYYSVDHLSFSRVH